MEPINLSDNALAVVRTAAANIEELGGTASISVDDTAGDFVSALNTVFGDADGVVQLSTDDTAEDFIEHVNDNFDAAADSTPKVRISFLHASDPHGTAAFTTKMSNDMALDDEIAFAIVTGDFKAYGVNSPLMYYDSQNDSGELKKVMRWGLVLGTSGNHDSYDEWTSGDPVSNSRMKDWLYSLMGNNVTWGDTDGQTNVPLQSAYYHKDFTKEGKTLRLIALDQYEIDATGATSRYYYVRYSQKQINWFINLLKTTPSSYHIIIVMHQCPFDDNDYASVMRPQPDTVGGSTYVNAPTKLLFCSEKISNTPFREFSDTPWMNTIVNIVRAYLGLDGVSRLYEEEFRNAGSNTPFNIEADFAGITPAHFCCYVVGHTHCDIGTWLPYEQYGVDKELYPRQLSVGITAADKNVPLSSTDDLDDSSVNTSYRINKVTIVFATENSVPQVIVERIGTKLTDGGRNRDKVRFWLNDEQTVDIPT